MNKRMLLAVIVGLSLSGGAFAQSDTAARLRGKIDTISGDTAQLTLRNGNKATATLPANLRVTWITSAKPTNIAVGSFIGTAAVPQADGTWKALEIQVFPPGQGRGGEGDHPFDLAPQSTMTNGTIGTMVAGNGRTITITYKGGEKKVVVPDNVPFVSYAPADRSALTPGANVIVSGTRAADGVVTATSVSVGKDGLVPPM